MKISFLGGGNMASALIGGMIARGADPADLAVVERDPAGCARLHAQFGVRASDAFATDSLACEVLVLAVKPQQMREAVAPLAGRLDGPLVVSIAAGITLEALERWLGGYQRLVRCMPNTPALIGAGVTGLFAHPSVDPVSRESAQTVLDAVGTTLWVEDEALMDAVTALSGSGPAYVFHFIEGLEAAGGEMGLDAAAARKLAIGTVLGAARLAAESGESPALLRERVTSKGGTTEAALRQMQADGFMALLARALRAAQARGAELGEQLGNAD
jgi:pyrroline-5-carboxylate reductase